jgi:gliding motility-associated-like protein
MKKHLFASKSLGMPKWCSIAGSMVLALGLTISTASAGELQTSTGIEFIENKGQIVDFDGKVRNDVKFKANAGNCKIYFSENSAAYFFEQHNRKSTTSKTVEEMNPEELKQMLAHDSVYYYRMDLKFEGANPNPEIVTENPSAFYSNYYQAHCANGITSVRHYETLIYKNMYPNIDVKFHSSERGMKYDIILHPGADLSQVKVRYDGGKNVHLEGADLVMETPLGIVRETMPESFYQAENGERTSANIHYQIKKGIVQFESESPIEEFVSGTFVIDPVLVWSTYYDYQDNSVFGIEADARGNQAVSVSVTSDNAMPTLDPGSGAWFQAAVAGGTDLRIIQFSDDGVRQWATYYGGSGTELVKGGIKIGSTRRVWIAASSASTDFPTFDAGSGAWFETNPGTNDQIVLMRFNGNGIREWATFYMGTSTANAYDIDLDANDAMYVVGDNGAGNTISTMDMGGGAYYQATPSANSATDADGIILKFDNTGVRQWATYFGADNAAPPTDVNESFKKVKVSLNGDVFIAGIVDEATTILMDAGEYFDNTHNGGSDVMALKFLPSGVLDWSTYFGGTADEVNVYGIASDFASNLYITGVTQSGDYPTFDMGGGAYFDNSMNGTQSGFLVKFDNKTELDWSTFIGSPSIESRLTCTSSSHISGKLYLAGTTDGTTGMPVLDPGAGSYYSGTGLGTENGYVAQFDSAGVQEWGSYVSTAGQTRYFTVNTIPHPSCGDQIYITGDESVAGYPTADPGAGAYVQNYSGSGTGKFIITRFDESYAGNPSWLTPGIYCESDGLIDMDTTVLGDPGGTWSGPGITGNMFDPTGLSGAVVIEYNLTSGGCSDSLEQTINVVPIQDPSWDNSTPVCEGGGLYDLDALITGNTGGTWLGPGVTGNMFDPTGLVGTVSISYTVGLAPCLDSLVQNLTVMADVDPGWTSPGTICESAGSINLDLLVTGNTGGNWSGTGVTGNTFDPTGLSGPISITYNVGPSPCDEVSNQLITVNPDVDPLWTNPGTVCESGGFVDLAALITGTTGGSWSGTGVAGTTFNPSGLGGQTIPVTYTVGLTPCEETHIENIFVEPDVDSSWTQIGVVCETNGLVNLDNQITGTTGGSWSGTGVTGNMFDPSGLLGVYNITYTVGNAPCIESLTYPITVVPGVDPTWVSPDTICESDGMIDLTLLVTGTTGGNWSGIGVSGTMFDPTGLSGQTIDINYVVGFANCIDSLELPITVLGVVSATWAAPDTLCEAAGTVNLDLLITGTSGGTWSGTGVTGNTFDPTGLSGQIMITYSVGFFPCNGTSPQNIEIMPDVDPGWISPGSWCEFGSMIDLDTLITGTTGGTWSGQGVTGSIFNPSTLNGLIAITYTVGTGQCAETDTQNIDVTGSANASWSSPGTVCESDGPINLDPFINGTIGGVWSGQGVSGSFFDPAGLTGSIAITYDVGVAPCDNSLTQNITINPAPAAPIVIALDTTICEGESTSINASGSGSGVVYHVYDALTGGTQLGTTPLVVSPTTTITYYIEVLDGNNCTNLGGRQSITIIVNPLPNASAGSDVSICNGDAISLTASGGTNYVWTTTDTVATITVTPSVTTTYTVLVTSAQGCTATDDVLVTVVAPGSILTLDDNASTVQNIPVLIDAGVNDIGDVNSFTILSGPSHGTTSLASGAIFEYTPDTDYVGMDSVQYSLCDPTCPNVCDTAWVIIRVDLDPETFEVKVPTGFSPNGDGTNDAFVIEGIELFPESELIVFNRWGNQVYQSKPYNNDWKGESEKGGLQLMGDQVVDGTYFYILHLGEGIDSQNGYIELRRQ